MPQLDSVTFLSQFFWLCVIYLGFYYTLAKYYLPKIGRILALRHSKLGLSHTGVHSVHQEHTHIRTHIEKLVTQACGTSAQTLHDLSATTQEWITTHGRALDATQYHPANTTYVSHQGDTGFSDQILVNYRTETSSTEATCAGLVRVQDLVDALNKGKKPFHGTPLYTSKSPK